MYTSLQFRCEYLSVKIKDLWFSQGQSIIDDHVAWSEDFKEGYVVYTLENVNLFLSAEY